MTSKLTITDERLAELVAFKPLPGTDINSATRDEWMAMAAELQERRKAAMDSEPVYQCEFCHADVSGELQWHWEDVNKDFYEQYDSERRGQRRILYSAPQAAPVVSADLLHSAASAIEDLLTTKDRTGAGVWFDLPFKLRSAANAQQPVVPDDVQRDAKRWRALLGSARIRILGSAGFDATAHPGENPDYRHFGMEIWTHYPNWLHEKNEYGIDTLTQYADAMLAAAPHDNPALNSVQSVATMSGGWIPVSERMPDDDDFVYIWPRPDFGVDLHVGQYCECSPKGEGWYAQIYEQNYGVDWHPITVTHWMPLPAAPQEVKGE
ncbi:DUF551 domain-containing protein [Raoultella ornithinolytica]|uniref:DUF551 domain-containing protein n=1 Tax=Raoultella ornithinolytica TaxID=54291 RepID=UPI0030CB1E5B